MPTNQDTMTADAGNYRRLWWLAMLIFAASAVMIIMSARGDFFLDEITSYNRVMGAHSWTDIFTAYQNDNNHPLNSLFMYWLGDQRNYDIYRIPPVAFGMALVVLLMFTSRRLGKTMPVWVACLAGLSFPIILPSSEARGYSPSMFFGVLAFELIQQCWEQFAPWKLALFWAALGLGFISHYAFIMVCLALGIWSLLHDRLAGASMPKIALNALKYHGVPLVIVAGVYLVCIRHMHLMGGPTPMRWMAISDAAMYVLGFAPLEGLRVPAVLLGLGLFVFGLWKLHVEKRDVWIFFAAIILIAPALVFVLWQPQYIYFRYFSVCFPFFYLLLAYVLAEWFAQRGVMRLAAVLMTAAITTGHMVKNESLLRYGRGKYLQALLDMAAATPGPVVRVSSDHDFRNGSLVVFYARYLPPSKQVDYITRPRRDQVTPDWFIQHCGDPTFNAYDDVEVGGIGKYDLFHTYPYCGSSGWSWFVYHRDPNATPATAQATQPAGANNNAAR